MRKIILFFLLLNVSIVEAKENKNIIGQLVDAGQLVKDATDIVGNIGLNCIDPTRLPQNIAYFVQEFYRIVGGIGRLTSESALLLAMKKDFPQMCHVMTKAHIASYSEGKDVKHEKKCSLKGPFGGCLAHKKIKKERPKPTYYWPKYFLEITTKGHDPHPSFAKKNALYTANRKIAAGLAKKVDVDGAIKLGQYVFGGKALLGAVGMDVGGNDLGELTKAKALTPFEKMRIRATRDKTNATYDVNVWPVALSDLYAAHFTVCGPVLMNEGKSPGGYSWPFKGVPMTCPIALTADFYHYWDTGLLDYLDPETVSAMAIGSNPVSCGAAEGMRALSNLGGFSGGAIGDRGSITSSLSNLGAKLKKGLSGCSWPVLGKGEAIAKKALSMASSAKWKQAKCTLWGSVAPRMSISPYENDYSFANTALKGKLLSHEIMGLERGREERFSLAYPWEGPGADSYNGKFKSLAGIYEKVKASTGGVLSKMGINLSTSDGGKSRSEALLAPGSPLMLNASFTGKYFRDQASNFAKELGYLGGLFAAGSAAGNAVKKSESANNEEDEDEDNQIPTQQGTLRQYQDQLSDAEEDTAHLKKEAIWKAVDYCHKRDSRGTLVGGQSFSVGGQRLSFRKGVSRSSCLSNHKYRGCLKMKRGKCRRANHVYAVHVKRMELSGYRKVKHPVHKKYAVSCSGSGTHKHTERHRWGFKKYTTVVEEVHKTNCNPVETQSIKEDTTQYVQRPDPKDPSTLSSNSGTNAAIAAAATAAPWVAAEVARAKYSEILGNNPVPGNKRIYTVWEKIQCTYPSTRLTIKVGLAPEIRKYENCQAAIRFELYKYIQLKLIRKICDLLGQDVGKPWK